MCRPSAKCARCLVGDLAGVDAVLHLAALSNDPSVICGRS
jgi:hypothetical protein